MVFWCGGGLFSAPEAVQREKVRKIGKRLFLIGFQKGGSTTGKGSQNWQKAIFNNRISEGTLDSFLVRFRGVSVLHCHGVLVWRRAVFSTGGSTTGKGWQNWQKTIFNIGTGGSTTGKGSQNWQKAIFNRTSEGTLDTFLVRFRGVSVLHCHGVLVWRSIGKRLFLIGFQKGR